MSHLHLHLESHFFQDKVQGAGPGCEWDSEAMCQQGWTEICTQGIIISFEDTSHDCHDYDDEILVKIVGGLSNSPIKCFLCANPPLSLITHVMTSYDTHCH